MAKKKSFDEEGNPLQHNFETMEFDHLGKKVIINVGGLEILKRVELERIIKNFLDNGEEPTMRVLDSFDAIGMKRDVKAGTSEVYQITLDKMDINDAPYYKVKEFKVISQFNNIYGAADDFRMESARKFLRWE